MDLNADIAEFISTCQDQGLPVSRMTMTLFADQVLQPRYDDVMATGGYKDSVRLPGFMPVIPFIPVTIVERSRDLLTLAK